MFDACLFFPSTAYTCCLRVFRPVWFGWAFFGPCPCVYMLPACELWLLVIFVVWVFFGFCM
ncbi:unnamed protein product [Brassica oleracea var. botrytis]